MGKENETKEIGTSTSWNHWKRGVKDRNEWKKFTATTMEFFVAAFRSQKFAKSIVPPFVKLYKQVPPT